MAEALFVQSDQTPKEGVCEIWIFLHVDSFTGDKPVPIPEKSAEIFVGDADRDSMPSMLAKHHLRRVQSVLSPRLPARLRVSKETLVQPRPRKVEAGVVFLTFDLDNDLHVSP